MPHARADYDVVCIGSSPLIILEALHQDRLGKRTLLVEAASDLGGAWQDCQLFGLQRVEIAPHIVTFDRRTYEYFPRHLGVQMQPMSPPPSLAIATRWGWFWVPYVLSPLITFVSVPIHCLRHPHNLMSPRSMGESFGRLAEATCLISQWLFSRLKPQVQYPVGGTREILDRLKERLARSAIAVRLNERVETIEQLEAGCLKVVTSRDSVLARQVIMTEHQKLGEVAVGDQRRRLNYEDAQYQSLHLLVETKARPRSAFVQTKRDPVVSFLSDLTSFTLGVPASHRLLVVRLQCWEKPQDREGAADMMQLLVRNGYLAKDCKLKDYHFSSYRQGRISDECRDTLRTWFDETVTVLSSTNFAGSLGEQIDRWVASEAKALSQGSTSQRKDECIEVSARAA